MSERGDVTVLLHAFCDGDREAFDRLVPLVYDDLRRIARRHMGRGRGLDTLDTSTARAQHYTVFFWKAQTEGRRK